MYNRRAEVEYLRKAYLVGTRVELLRMDDIQAPPEGTRGTVRGVDDMWDNGSRLSVVYGIDAVKIITE